MSTDTNQRSWQDGVRGGVVGALLAAVTSVMGMVVALRAWHLDFGVPIQSQGDVMLSLAAVRTMQTSGWDLSSSMLGFPLGQDLRAYPGSVGDLWNLLGLKLVSLVASPAATVNVFFLLSFPVCAAVTFWCMRRLGVRWWTSVALAAAYAWLPYHFLRSETHLLLSAYAVLPLACVLIVEMLRGHVQFGRGRRRAWIAPVAVAVALGGCGLYYAGFSLVVLVSVAVVAALAVRSPRPLLAAFGLSAITAAVMGIGSLPTVLYVARHGSPAVESRGYFASEYYGLKLSNLLLPIQGHRLALFATIRARIAETSLPGEGGTETLGLLGAAGFVAVVVAALLASRHTVLGVRLRRLGVVALVAVMWSTVAGLGAILAAAGVDQLRGWDRMSVLIGFVALAGTGLAVDTATGALRRRTCHRRRVPWEIGVAAILAVVALADQTTPTMVPDYAHLGAAWRADRSYFARVQDNLGAGAAVFQLPLVPYPENPPVVDMPDYDHLRGFLHSDLRWSYGAVKDATADWQTGALSRGVAAALPALVATGFEAVYVNRRGYADSGESVTAELSTALNGERPWVNDDGTLEVYDLRPYTARLAASGTVLPDRELVLDPARLVPVSGLYDTESDATSSWRWARATATFVVAGAGVQEVRLVGKVRVATPDATVAIQVGETRVVLTASGGTVSIDVPLDVRAGSTLTLTSDSAATIGSGSDPRDLVQQLVDLTLQPTW